MAKNRFGGAAYAPNRLGPEPASAPPEDPPAAAAQHDVVSTVVPAPSGPTPVVAIPAQAPVPMPSVVDAAATVPVAVAPPPVAVAAPPVVVATAAPVVPSIVAAPPPVAPATPQSSLAASAAAAVESGNAAELEALRSLKVPFSSRITVAADRQLKALARQGHTQTDLLAEALNLLFKKHGLERVA